MTAASRAVVWTVPGAAADPHDHMSSDSRRAGCSPALRPLAIKLGPIDWLRKRRDDGPADR